MILVRIYSTEEKFVIELQHKIKYAIEKDFGSIKSINKRTIYVFAQLFIAAAKLISKEFFARTV